VKRRLAILWNISPQSLVGVYQRLGRKNKVNTLLAAGSLVALLFLRP
jgi:hypothetical protein